MKFLFHCFFTLVFAGLLYAGGQPFATLNAQESPSSSAAQGKSGHIPLANIPGIVLDAATAELKGDWKDASVECFLGSGSIQSAPSKGKRAEAKFQGKVPIAGEYDIRLIWSKECHQATSMKIRVVDRRGSSLVPKSASKHFGDGLVARFLGTFSFDASRDFAIEILSDAADEEPICIDAVQLLPTSKHLTPRQPIQAPKIDELQLGKHTVQNQFARLLPFRVTIPGTQVSFQMMPVPALPVQESAGEGEEQSLGFWVGQYEVSLGEYFEFMRLNHVFPKLANQKLRVVNENSKIDAVTAPTFIYDPQFRFEHSRSPKFPATTMTRYAARQYTKWLSLSTGIPFRLPTEREWEHACQAGAEGPWSFAESEAREFCNYLDPASDRNDELPIKPAGTLKANAWGLHDMHGNVSEWVIDEKMLRNHFEFKGDFGDYRSAWDAALKQIIYKGGSCEDSLDNCRISVRRSIDEDFWIEDPAVPASAWWFASEQCRKVGFRVVVSANALTRERLEAFWGPDTKAMEWATKELSEMSNGNYQGLVDEELPDLVEELAPWGTKKPPWTYR